MSDYSDFVERFGGLCEELDIRKVEWDETSRNTIEWKDARDSLVLATKDPGSNLLYVRAWMTQEQAIEATLGAGTCNLSGFADVKINVEYEVEGYDPDSGTDYGELTECSACGAYVIVPPAYHHVLTCYGDEVYGEYRFCPNCGAKVIDEEENA